MGIHFCNIDKSAEFLPFPSGIVLTSVDRQNAARNQRDQGLPPEGAAEGRQECQNQAKLGERQIQGSLLSVPEHTRHHGQGEGREAEAVFAAWSSGQGAQVTQAAPRQTPSEEPRSFCVLYYALEHLIKGREAMKNQK